MDLRLHPSFTSLHPTSFVANTATVVGDVRLAEDANVWFGAVLRGDTDHIDIGPRTNIQDGAVVHVDPGMATTIGADVTVGHNAIVHAATVHDGALIGMGAIVLNGAVIGARCLVGAGALVTPGKVFGEGLLIVGSPARAIRALTPEEIADQVSGASTYVEKARAFKEAGHGQ